MKKAVLQISMPPCGNRMCIKSDHWFLKKMGFEENGYHKVYGILFGCLILVKTLEKEP